MPARKKSRQHKRLPARHPAESAGLAAGVAGLIAHLIGVDDPATLAYLTVIVGGVPGVVTWLTERFGS